MPINIGSWNACGLRHNVQELRHYVEKHNIHIMTINETKLTPDIKIKIKNFNILRRDRTAHGGGVAILIKNNIPYITVDVQNRTSIEHLAIKLINNIFIVAAYNNPRNIFTDLDLKTLTDIGTKTLIIGDLNARHHTWKNHITNTNGRTLYKHITDKNMIVLHTEEPTHFPHNNATPTYIDIVINKNVNKITKLTTHTELTSDHNPIMFTLNDQHTDNTTTKCTSYKTTDWVKFRKTLNNNININKKIKTNSDVDMALAELTSAIINTKNKHTKQIKINFSKLDLSQEIKNLIKARNALRRLDHRRVIQTIKPDINKLNKVIRQKIRQQLNQQWEDTLKSLKPGDKSLWRITKSFRHKKENIPTLIKDNTNYMSDKQKADLIADSIEAVQQNNNISPLDNTVRQSVIELQNKNDRPKKRIKLTSPQEIKQTIRKLPNNKAPGQDNIQNKDVKNLSTKALVQLTYIVNAMFALGYYPEAWKTALVVPILKPNKNPTDPASYRPISLLSSLSKVVEKLILSRLNKVITQKNILIDEQFGFREGHGTTMQVARIADSITKNFNKGNVTSMVLLDVEKAFDTVWIEGAIHKIYKTGIPTQLSRLMACYLQNRNFRLKIKTKKSTVREIRAGVPQGSVLGPIIFNIYINDMPKFAKTNLAVYADDTAIYAHSFNAQVATKQVQIHLDMILKFANDWKIKINDSKTEHILFTKKFTNIKITSPLKVNGMSISTSNKVKYLGVYLDKGMSFVPQINHLVAKGHGVVRTLYPLLNRYSALTLKTKKLLYDAIIKPVITNAAPVWCSASKTQFIKLQRIQNKCLRLVANADRLITIKKLHSTTDAKTIKEVIKTMSEKFYKHQIHKSNLTKNMIIDLPAPAKHKLIYHTLEPGLQ